MPQGENCVIQKKLFLPTRIGKNGIVQILMYQYEYWSVRATRNERERESACKQQLKNKSNQTNTTRTIKPIDYSRISTSTPSLCGLIFQYETCNSIHSMCISFFRNTGQMPLFNKFSQKHPGHPRQCPPRSRASERMSPHTRYLLSRYVAVLCIASNSH